MAGTQGAEEIVPQSQSHPQQARRPKPLEGKRRGRHPSNRLNQPPLCFGSS